MRKLNEREYTTINISRELKKRLSYAALDHNTSSKALVEKAVEALLTKLAKVG